MRFRHDPRIMKAIVNGLLLDGLDDLLLSVCKGLGVSCGPRIPAHESDRLHGAHRTSEGCAAVKIGVLHVLCDCRELRGVPEHVPLILGRRLRPKEVPRVRHCDCVIGILKEIPGGGGRDKVEVTRCCHS